LSQLQNNHLKVANGEDRLRILHVDDDKCILEVVENVLEMENNFDVDNALSVAEAYNKIGQQIYDVIVSDYEMPQKNGLQFLQELREKQNRIPFVIFTGKGREEVAVKALNLGADGYYNKQGSPECVYGELAHGIRSAFNRRKSEEALIISEENYSGLINGMNDTAWVIDFDGNFVAVNDKAVEVLGYSKEELMSLGIKDIDKCLSEDQVKKLVGCIPAHGAQVFETVHTTKDGTKIPVEISSRLVIYQGKQAILSIAKNITMRKKAEETLEISDNGYRLLFSSMFEGVAYCRLIWGKKGEPADFVYLDVNDAFEKLTGFKKSAVLGKNASVAIPGIKEQNPELFEIYGRVASTGKKEKFNTYVKPLAIWLSVSVYSPRKDHFVAIFENITKRKKTEEELSENERKYRSLFSAMSEGFCLHELIYDKSGKVVDYTILDANPAYESLVGLKKEAIIGKNASEIYSTNEPPYLDRYAKIVETSEPTYFETYYPPLKKHFSISVFSPGKNRFATVFTDVTARRKGEQEIAALKDFNQIIVESISETLLVIDPKDYRIISANREAARELKRGKQDLIGKTCYETTHHRSTPCTLPNDVCPMQEMLKTKNSITVEHQHFDQDNSKLDVEVSAHPILDKDGKIVQVVHISRDITKRKQQEREEKAKSDETDAIIDGIGDLLFVMDKNRVITKVNKVTCDAFKKSPEELLGKHCFEIVHGTDQPWPECPATKTFETKQTVTEEINDPNLGIPLLVTTSPILDENGEVAQIIHVAKDISKIKMAEMEMHLAANLFEAASDSILVYDPEGKIVYFNEAAHNLRGYSREEFQGLKISDLEAPGSILSVKSRIAALLEKGEGVFEALNLHKDQTVVPFEVHAQVIEFDGKKMVLSVARDITERKKAEQKLKESEEKYETTFEASMDALMLLDEKGFFDCNAATLLLFGCRTKEEFTKNHPADLSPPKQPDGSNSMEAAMTHINKAYETGMDNFFWIHKRINGQTFPAEVLLTRMPMKGRNVLQATVRDITERKKAEESLKKSEQKYREFADSLPEIVFEADDKGKLTFVNKQVVEIIGYSNDELKQMNVFYFLAPEDRQRAIENVQKRLKGEKSSGNEFMFLRKDGSKFPGMIFSEKIMTAEGNLGLRGVIVNISQLKEVEEQLKEDRERIELMNEKLRVVGSLTRHDVRNKLSAVTGYAYLIKKKHPGQPDILEGLGKMEQAVAETIRIFDFAKMYEQIGAEKLSYVDVAEKLKEAVALFSGSLPKILNECYGLVVLADSFLRQLLYNFVDNTRKYGNKTTAIRVYYETADSGDLRLVYEDDGVGISAENKLRLFSEGFSTGGSTGYGLFLTKRMMDVYGWHIQESGEPGKGAKFTITIPKLNKKGKENFQTAGNP
jgi:PAS domain S-box-containing protein